LVGLCRWPTIFGRFLVVYYRIAQISRPFGCGTNGCVFASFRSVSETHSLKRTHTLTISRTLVFTSRRPLLGSHPPDRRRGKDAGVDNNVYECTSKALDQLERDGEAHGSAEAQQQSVSQLTVRSVYMRSVLTVIVVVTCSANANGAGLTAATDRAGHLW
jgi:hypothetical protein